ncbi:helix-turn-helix domain-containing protein [Bradyrhizobium sp. 2TAF36]|uniref:helix-turn-helix domain-containing protein n=1 Tax=Bradyrhizobium sp. 2TAF36 TaxID=3233016 RepID=UPI003F8F5575
MAIERTYLFSGISRRNGTMHCRFSNRPQYEGILRKEGDTDVVFVRLPRPMSKKEASEHLAQQSEFQSAEIRECLGKWAVAEGDDGETLGQRLKKAREQRGLSIAEAASAVGRSKESVWGLEYHNRMPRDGKLADFAKLYRVSESWLREGGSGGPNHADGASDRVDAAQAQSPAQGMTGAEYLALARKALAAEQSVHETCVTIEVAIRFGGDASQPCV